MLGVIKVSINYYAEEDCDISCRTSDMFIDKEIEECTKYYEQEGYYPMLGVDVNNTKEY